MTHLEMDWIIGRDMERQREIENRRYAFQVAQERMYCWGDIERRNPTANIFASAVRRIGRVGADYKPCGEQQREEAI